MHFRNHCKSSTAIFMLELKHWGFLGLFFFLIIGEENIRLGLCLLHFVTKEFPFELLCCIQAPSEPLVNSSQSLQCPDVIQCMHKLCYCLTESRGCLWIAVSSVCYLFLPHCITEGNWPFPYLLDFKTAAPDFCFLKEDLCFGYRDKAICNVKLRREESGSLDSLDCIVWLHDPCCVAVSSLLSNTPSIFHSFSFFSCF